MRNLCIGEGQVNSGPCFTHTVAAEILYCSTGLRHIFYNINDLILRRCSVGHKELSKFQWLLMWLPESFVWKLVSVSKNIAGSLTQWLLITNSSFEQNKYPSKYIWRSNLTSLYVNTCYKTETQIHPSRTFNMLQVCSVVLVWACEHLGYHCYGTYYWYYPTSTLDWSKDEVNCTVYISPFIHDIGYCWWD